MNTPTRKQVLCHPLLKKGGEHRPSKKQPRKQARESIESALDAWFEQNQKGNTSRPFGDEGADQYSTLHFFKTRGANIVIH